MDQVVNGNLDALTNEELDILERQIADKYMRIGHHWAQRHKTALAKRTARSHLPTASDVVLPRASSNPHGASSTLQRSSARPRL